MFVSKAVSKTPAIALFTLLFMLTASLSFAGDKNEKNGYLGVMLQDINSGLAKAMDLDDDNGVLISEVVEDGPAEKAGLQEGDVIIRFQGKDLEDYETLTKAVRASSPGDLVDVVVLRDGREKTIEVEMGERSGGDFFFSNRGDNFPGIEKCRLPNHGENDVFVWHDGDSDDLKIMFEGMDSLREDRGFIGVELTDINGQMGEYFDVEDGEGALITSVIEDSPAEKAGLKAGDVIIKLGDEKIESAKDVHQVMSDTQPEDDLEVRVIRKGKKKTLDVTLDDLPEDQLLSQLKELSGKDDFNFHSPKMLFHGMPRAPHAPGDIHREIRIITESEDDLKEMRSELEEMKKELQEMKKELQKK